MTGTTTVPRKDGVKEDPGAAYLKRSSLGYDLEKQLLEESRQRMDALLKYDCEHKDWYSRWSFHGVAVTSKKEPDNPFCMTKGITDLPPGMTLEEAGTQFSSDFRTAAALEHIYHRVDPMNLQLTVVTQVEHKELLDESKKEQLRILWGAFYIAPLISDRDFCFIQHNCFTTCPVTGDQVFVSNSFSWEFPDMVPDMQATLGRVRAEIQLTGYLFRPHPTEANRLTGHFLVQADPKGYLPASLVNAVSVSQAMNMGRVRDIYNHMQLEVKPYMKDFAYPLDSYQMARRGGTIVHGVPLKAPPEAGTGTPFYVRLQVYSEHSITVQLEDGVVTTDDGYTLESLEGDDTSDTLVSGKAVTFGGKPDSVMDTVVKVTLTARGDDSSIPELPLQFTNHGWKKNIIYMPVNTIISSSPPAMQANENEQ